MWFTKNILFFIFFNLIIEFNLISQNYTWMHGIFAIETFDLDIDIKIYNPLGLIIYSEFLNKGIHHLSLSSFSNGLYLIEIKTIKGILNKKIIKAN